MILLLLLLGLALTLGFILAYARHNYNNPDSVFHKNELGDEAGPLLIIIAVFSLLWPITVPAFLVYKLTIKVLNKNKNK
jgi:hypothetical protein